MLLYTPENPNRPISSVCDHVTFRLLPARPAPSSMTLCSPRVETCLSAASMIFYLYLRAVPLFLIIMPELPPLAAAAASSARADCQPATPLHRRGGRPPAAAVSA